MLAHTAVILANSRYRGSGCYLTHNMSASIDENQPSKGWFESLRKRLSIGNHLHSRSATQRTSLGFSQLAIPATMTPRQKPYTTSAQSPQRNLSHHPCYQDSRQRLSREARMITCCSLLMRGFRTSMSSSVNAVSVPGISGSSTLQIKSRTA